MGKVFIDTSGWFALFVANDYDHKKAQAIFSKIEREKPVIYTSDYVIDETITLISARCGHQLSIEAGEVLIASESIKIINVCPDYFEEAWKFYKKYRDKDFSFTDVTSFAIMQKIGIKKAFSFDDHFPQAGMELLD